MKRSILSINSFNMFALALVCFEESNYFFPPLTLSTHNISFFFFEQLNQQSFQSFQTSNVSVEFSTWITNFNANSFCGKCQIFFKFSSYQVLDVDHFLTIFKAPKGVVRRIRVNKKKETHGKDAQVQLLQASSTCNRSGSSVHLHRHRTVPLECASSVRYYYSNHLLMVYSICHQLIFAERQTLKKIKKKCFIFYLEKIIRI